MVLLVGALLAGLAIVLLLSALNPTSRLFVGTTNTPDTERIGNAMQGNIPIQPTPFADLAVSNAIVARYFGMSVKTYKIIKALTQLVAVAGGVYAMHLGAEPLPAFVLVATIISGPEMFEMLLTSQDAPDP